MPTKTINVKTDEENPESVEIIADSIIKIADSFERIQKGRLQRRALVLLIQDNCEQIGSGYRKKPISIRDVEKVLDSIETLKKAYIKELKKK